MRKETFFECTKCYVWGKSPINFVENKHFVICPKCDKSMYLFRSLDPLNEGLNIKNKVLLAKLVFIKEQKDI